MQGRGQRSCRRAERGAAAVELGIVGGILLMPLLLGVLQFGHYFWNAQRVDAVTPGVPVGGVVGSLTCDQLKDQVATSVVAAVTDLDLGSLLPVDVDDVTVTVVQVLPDVGATVRIHIEAPSAGGLASLLPLPDGGALVTDFTQRLSDVRVTTVGCR